MPDFDKAELLAPNLDYVRERVAAASEKAGRSDVTLVAVSKLMELPVLKQAYDHGWEIPPLPGTNIRRLCSIPRLVPLAAPHDP
jgi:hypothetical protein